MTVGPLVTNGLVAAHVGAAGRPAGLAGLPVLAAAALAPAARSGTGRPLPRTALRTVLRSVHPDACNGMHVSRYRQRNAAINAGMRDTSRFLWIPCASIERSA